MALGDVLKAVKARWDAKSLSDTITGGIHRRRGEQVTAPCVIVSTIAGAVLGTASRGEGTGTRYENAQIQFLLVAKAGPQAAKTMIDSIKAAFDWAPLDIDGGDLIYCKFVSEIDLDDPEDPGNPNAVLWALTYDVQTAESTTLSPA